MMTSRSTANPNVIGSPDARTTRMFGGHAPERLAVGAGHHGRRVEQRGDREAEDPHDARRRQRGPAGVAVDRQAERATIGRKRISAPTPMIEAVDELRADARPPARQHVAARRGRRLLPEGRCDRPAGAGRRGRRVAGQAGLVRRGSVVPPPRGSPEVMPPDSPGRSLIRRL